jgi:hypothetical protein
VVVKATGVANTAMVNIVFRYIFRVHWFVGTTPPHAEEWNKSTEALRVTANALDTSLNALDTSLHVGPLQMLDFGRELQVSGEERSWIGRSKHVRGLMRLVADLM